MIINILTGHDIWGGGKDLLLNSLNKPISNWIVQKINMKQVNTAMAITYYLTSNNNLSILNESLWHVKDG